MGDSQCIASDADGTLKQVVAFLDYVDKSISWRRSFRDFGAAEPDRISVRELQVRPR